MASPSLPVLQGTLDLIILGTLADGPSHGYGIAMRVDEETRGQIVIEDAALYQALHRLERQRYIDAEWRASENNRRARYYSLTPVGRKRLSDQAGQWRRYSRLLDSILKGIS